jgi:hypothetical protein
MTSTKREVERQRQLQAEKWSVALHQTPEMAIDDLSLVKDI